MLRLIHGPHGRFHMLRGSVSSVSLTRYAASYGVIDCSVDAWKPYVSPNQRLSLTCDLMTLVGYLFGSGL